MTFAEQLASLRRTLHRAFVTRLVLETRRPVQQLLALRVISREQVRTQAALADRLLIDAPAASRLVDRLVRDGLLKRRTGTDRRSVALEVTPASAGELAALERTLVWLDREIHRRSSSKDVKAMVGLMRQLQESFTTPSEGEGRTAAAAKAPVSVRRRSRIAGVRASARRAG